MSARTFIILAMLVGSFPLGTTCADIVLTFEEPAFAVGDALKDKGFTPFDGLGENSGFISSVTSSEGVQSASILGSGLGEFDTFYGVFFGYEVNRSDLASITIAASLRLDYLEVDQFDATSGIQIYDTSGQYIAGFGVSNLRGLYYDNYDYEYSATAGANQMWQEFSIEIDFLNSQISGTINGIPLPPIALNGPATNGISTFDLTFATLDPLDQSIAYFDNIRFSSTAVPEPHAWASFIVGGCMIGIPAYRRRRMS